MCLLFGHRHSHIQLQDRAKTLSYNIDTYLERFSCAHTIQRPHEVLFSAPVQLSSSAVSVDYRLAGLPV